MPGFNEQKTLNSMLYLMQLAGCIGLYSLVKLLYFADKQHLHRWGRTITGDNYVRMRYGPTPSGAYDMLKSVRGDDDWPSDLNPYFYFVRKNSVALRETPNLDVLSDSEITVLDRVYRDYGHMTFQELKKEAHDAVYECSTERYISLEQMAEGDTELLEYIAQQKEDEKFIGDC